MSDTDLTHWQASQIAARDAMLYGLGAVGFNNADHPMAYYRIPPSSVFLVPPDSLDAAWAEAEAALPDNGEQIAGLTPTGAGGWYAHAYNISGERCDGIGPTPAAALRALAAKLRERGA